MQYGMLNALRHPGAWRAASDEGAVGPLDSLRGARHCLLITYKRTGAPVPTPVNCAVSDEGILYFRSEPGVGKMKRIRHDPCVAVCSCTFRGRPTGPMIKGVASLLPTSDEGRAHDLLAPNWDFFSRPVERLFDGIHVPIAYVQVRPLVS